ncbi:hypothetical protein SAMD00019534_032650, partial [Acytostelium subglobosum LB1]|uniref:hypothetical protein n=1 Tax=Acytostelium subglobosum LB1 TaxID=1410327 RepID=UPI0006449522
MSIKSIPQPVELKAGKAKLENKMLVSDTRKGTLKFSIQDELILVQWFIRGEKNAEDEYYIVPGELVFKKITACKDGRMYYLYLNTSDTKEFFWFQEENPDDDVKIEKSIDLIVKYNPDEITEPTPATPTPVTTTTTTTPATTQPTSSQSRPSGTSSTNPQAGMSEFYNFLSNYKPAAKSKLTLLGVLSPENLAPLMKNEEIQKELAEYLPESNRSSSDIMHLLHTPQFAQAIEQLNYAIHEGHGSDIVAQLGCEPSMAALSGVEGFLNCLQEGVDKQKKAKDTQQQPK